MVLQSIDRHGLPTDCWPHFHLSDEAKHHPASLCMTCGRHVESLASSDWLFLFRVLVVKVKPDWNHRNSFQIILFFLKIPSNYSLLSARLVVLGGLWVTCSPRDLRFTGSNPAEVDGFFQEVKILNTSPPEGT